MNRSADPAPRPLPPATTLLDFDDEILGSILAALGATRFLPDQSQLKEEDCKTAWKQWKQGRSALRLSCKRLKGAFDTNNAALELLPIKPRPATGKGNKMQQKAQQEQRESNLTRSGEWPEGSLAVVRATPSLTALRVPPSPPGMRPIASSLEPQISLFGLFAAMQGSSSLQELDLSRSAVADLSALSGCPGLTALDISGMQHGTKIATVAGLSPLTACSRLCRLTASDLSLSDLRPLVALTACLRLRRLGIADNPLSDLCPLAALKDSLEELDVSSCQRLADLGPLAACSRLRVLDCRDCRRPGEISDLHPLATLSTLEVLNVQRCPVSDLSPISTCHSLRCLDVSSCRISQPTPLTACTALEDLNASQCWCLDSLPLLPSLTSLQLCNTQVSDLVPLSACTGLRNLSFSNCYDIPDLAPLSLLCSLTALDCSKVDLWDLAPLAGLRHLTDLDCSGTEVSDLTPLSGLIRLKRLICGFNPAVSDLSPLAGLLALEELDLNFTLVSDLGPLAACSNLRELRRCRPVELS